MLTSVICCNSALAPAQELLLCAGEELGAGGIWDGNPPVFTPGSCTVLSPGYYKIPLFTLMM